MLTVENVNNKMSKIGKNANKITVLKKLDKLWQQLKIIASFVIARVFLTLWTFYCSEQLYETIVMFIGGIN